MAQSGITAKYAYQYVFSTVPVSDINKGLYKALVGLSHSLLQTLVSLLSVLFYVLIFIAKLLILLFPHALKLIKIVIEFHRTQLTVYDIVIEVLVLTLILVFLIFRKRIKKAWKDVEAFISKKSTAAAKAAPHVLFFGSSLLLTIVGKKFIMPLTSSSVMPVFTLLFPLCSTAVLLVKASKSSSQGHFDVTSYKNMSDQFHHKILLWVILASYHAIVTVLSLIPFSKRLLYLLPIGKELVIVVLLWVQLSPAFTDIVFKSVVTPILRRISIYLPTTESFESKVQQSNVLVRTLKMVHVISDSQEVFLRALLQDSLASLLALLFILTPNPLASVGMVAVALLLPAFRSAASSSALIKAKLTAKGTSGSGSESPSKLPTLMSVHRQWLDYWLCIGVLWCVRIYGFTVWPSLMMLSSLYLQHSYFLGASATLSWLVTNGQMVAQRNSETQAARHREKQQQIEAEQRLLEEQTMVDPSDSLNSEVSPSEKVSVEATPQMAAPPSGGEDNKASAPRRDYSDLKLRLAAASANKDSKVTSSPVVSKALRGDAKNVREEVKVDEEQEEGPFSAEKKKPMQGEELEEEQEEYVEVSPGVGRENSPGGDKKKN